MTRHRSRWLGWFLLVALTAASCGSGGGSDAASGAKDDAAASDDTGVVSAGPEDGAGGDDDGAPPAEALLERLTSARGDCLDVVRVEAAEGATGETRCLTDLGWIYLITFADEAARDTFVEDGGLLNCGALIGGGALAVDYVAGPDWVARPAQGLPARDLAEALDGTVATAECGPEGAAEALATVRDRLDDAGLACDRFEPAAAPPGVTAVARCLIEDDWAEIRIFADTDDRDRFIEGGGLFDCSFVAGLGARLTIEYALDETTVVTVAGDTSLDDIAAAIGGTVDSLDCGPVG